MDEFAIHKGHTYATCVIDLDEGDTLWVGHGQGMDDFEKFFKAMDEYIRYYNNERIQARTNHP